MLRILLTSFILLLLTACVSNSSLIISEPKKPVQLEESTILKIAIPVREHGYSTFNTQVISSQKAFDEFIANISIQKSWNKKDNFIDSLTLYPIDFTHYNLLLYRMTEQSGTTVLSVDAPKGDNKHIVIEIGRDKPSIGTADMAYYALAYKVLKSVKDITFDNGIKKHLIKNKSINIEKKPVSNAPEACLEWYDGCNNCGRIGNTGDVVCTERYCVDKGKFRCTKWKHDNYKLSNEPSPSIGKELQKPEEVPEK